MQTSDEPGQPVKLVQNSISDIKIDKITFQMGNK